MNDEPKEPDFEKGAIYILTDRGRQQDVTALSKDGTGPMGVSTWIVRDRTGSTLTVSGENLKRQPADS